MASDLTGQTFGQYKIIGVVGRGGMASVYHGYQESIDRSVAVKILPAELLSDPSFLTRFLQEARVLAKLTHPAILPLYEFGEVGGVPYIVMPLMPGGTLSGRLRQGPLALPDLVRVIQPIAEALAFAHQQGIVHSDVKPSNILFDQWDKPFLSDFGLAKRMSAQAPAPGRSGLATPEYMSPEQARGDTPDHRSDLYSLGVVIFEALTGRRPFETLDPLQLVYLHAMERPPSPRELRPDLSPAVERVILRALEKTPTDRYASAGEMATALANAAYLSRDFWRRPDGAAPKPIPEIQPIDFDSPTTEVEATIKLPPGPDEATPTRPVDSPPPQS